MLSVTSDFTKAFAKKTGTFFAAVDPGLKGGCTLFSPSLGKLLFFELPTKVGGVKGNFVLDLKELRTFLESFTADLTPPLEVYLTLEKPFKKPAESVLTFGVSMGIVGQLLALFELLPFDAWLYGVTPKEWTSFFDGHFLPTSTTLPKEKKKRARAEVLIEAFSFRRKDFFTPRGRLKDGVSDSVAILLWTLLKGEQKKFWRL